MVSAPHLILSAAIFHVSAIHTATKSAPAGEAEVKGACREERNSHCRHTAASKPLLITGSGGSGTHTLSYAFRLNGIALGHEDKLLQHGTVSWPFAVDGNALHFNDSWLRPTNETFNHVVHLVRCPRDTVSNAASHSDCSMKYIVQALNLTIPNDEWRTLRFDMLQWLRWNQHIESYAESRLRIDEIANQEKMREIMKSAGFEHEGDVVTPQRHENVRHHHSLTWEQMRAADEGLAAEIWAKATEYGFPPSCFDDTNEEPPDEKTVQSSPSNTVYTTDESMIWGWDRAATNGTLPLEAVFDDADAARRYVQSDHKRDQKKNHC